MLSKPFEFDLDDHLLILCKCGSSVQLRKGGGIDSCATAAVSVNNDKC